MDSAPVTPGWPRWRTWLVPAVLLLAVTLPHLSQGDWQRTDSGRYAAVGLQAWRTGDLWTLYSEPGVPYFNKPPLVLWFHGLVLHLFGTGPIQARLPAIAAALGCVLLTTWIVRRLVDARAAVVAGSALALTYEFFRRTREVSLDMWQLLFMLAGLALIVRAASEPPAEAGGLLPAAPHNSEPHAIAPGLFVAAGLCFALALLCKPMTALAAPLLIAIGLHWSGRSRAAAWVGVSAAVGIVVAGIWHVSMWRLHGPEFVAQYFAKEIGERAVAGLPESEGGHEPPWFYALQIARSYWPWLIPAVIGAWRGRGSPAWRLGIVWFAGWFVLLTLFPDRRDRYALPLYPALAMLAGLSIAHPLGELTRRRLDSIIDRAVPLAAGLAVFIALLPLQLQRPPDSQWDAVFEWMDAQAAQTGRVPELWQGAFGLERGARVYLRYGVWPRTTRDRLGAYIVDRVTQPPPGALLAYHRRDGLAPGTNEQVVFENRDVMLTRLGPGGWNPLPMPR